MKLSRIDQIALNGATGEHYKYEEGTDRIMSIVKDYTDGWANYEIIREEVMKILVEAFPNDA